MTVPDSLNQLNLNEGYIGLVFHSNSNLRMVEIYPEKQNQPKIHISYLLKGDNLLLYKLPVGIYCIERYAIGEIDVKIIGGGLCFDVAAGLINYPGHIVASYEDTFFDNKIDEFVKLLSKKYPAVCKEFLLSLCDETFLKEDKDYIRLKI